MKTMPSARFGGPDPPQNPRRPRMGYLLKKFPRLSETFVLGEILGQEALGSELHVFSRRSPDDEPRHPMMDGLQAAVEVMPQPGELDALTELFVAPGSEHLDLDGVRRVVRSMQPYGHPRLTRLIGEALWLRRRTRELGISHLHVHFATESAVTAHLLQALGGPSYSITAHAKDIYRSTVDDRLLGRLIQHSAFTVTVCDANVEHLAGLVGDAAMERVRRLYNGIDLEHFLPPVGEREPRHVLGVGRLVAKKGFDVLLQASALLRDRGIEHRLTVVGEGEERPTLEALLAEKDLGAHARLAGALPQDEVLALIQRATVLALPCRIGDDGNRDALPTVLLESLATGLPCISTPVTGVPEILDQGRAGRLVPENDTEALADAIATLLRDRQVRRELAATGRVRAEALFDRRKASRTLRAWFEEAACRRVV